MPDERTSAARRRLELLGDQLAAEQVSFEGADVTGDGHAPHAAGVTDPVRPEPPTGAGRHRAPTLNHRQRWTGELNDRLPGRWQVLLGRGLNAQHVVVVIALVAGLACLTAWWVVSSRPSPVEPIGAPVSTDSAATPAASPPSSPGAAASGASPPVTAGPANTPPGQVVVDVSGKVRKPGIVTLPAGSRVADALDSAGGPRRGAEADTLNLARVLVDGEQIVVGLPPVAAAGAPPGQPGGTTTPKVNLNTATQEQLETLPGVGPVTATSILDWRTENGRFSSVDELLEVDGIGDVTLADLRDLVTV